MSQQRTRKSVGAEPISRGRAAGKTPANVAPSNVQPKPRQRSSSKTKIPKTLRYELENALVGLCDVWFADIKPHLVRNNIKLHVHAAEVPPRSPASGDHRPHQLPPGAPGCSHFDPGAASDLQRHRLANSAGCCSTQPTASRAPCRRPPALSCPSQASSPVKHRTSFNQNPCDSCDARKPRRCSRRRARPPPPPPLPKWRVPRLCRTYTLVTHTPKTRRRPATELQYKYSPLSQARRPKTMDKATQTTSLRVPEAHPTRSHGQLTPQPQNSVTTALRKRQKRQSIAHHYYFPNNDSILQTQVIPQQIRLPDPTATNLRSGTKQSRRQTKRQPSIPTHQDADLRAWYEIDPSRVPVPCLQTLQCGVYTTRKQQKKRRAIPHHSDFAHQDLAVCRDLNQGTPSLAPCPRSPTTTNFFRPQKQQPRRPPALFQDDLIDIIAENKDKKLRLLFKSSPREEILSIMNLVHSVQARCDSKADKKNLPWRCNVA